MFQRADNTWEYAPEDRLLLHESSHALVDLILTGTPSRVTIASGYTGGICRKLWDPDMARDSGMGDAAYYCWGLHSAVAGIVAEELAFGSDDDEGTDHDRAAGRKAERYLAIVGVKAITWGKASMVTKSWLRTYGRSWRAGAKALYSGSHSPGQLESAFLAADTTGALRGYSRVPFLSDPSWLAQWREAYRQAVN